MGGPLCADHYVRTILVTAPEVIGARDGGNRPEQLPKIGRFENLLKPELCLPLSREAWSCCWGMGPAVPELTQGGQ